ncbi:hypothetical protein Ssi02_65000 [Sinosporangium siamense]|uniref:Uncharacterized protein n=1 Tax=Sinosporangium siamense TaxID=1367973 RepID=A0A919RPI7_9ACTN|nr:hypothetical protein Ssi02_65000 [Sinosporangium siamense]
MYGTAAATGVAWIGVMLARLFAGGAIGLAEQGDGKRLLCTFGVANARPWNADMWRHIYTTWVPHTWYGETCGADGSGEVYHSTQIWILWLAKLIHGPLGLPGALDTRAVGVVGAVFVGVLCGLFVLVLPGALRLRVLMSSAFGLVYADSAFAGYFISPFAEPAALLGLGALVFALLLLWRKGRATWPRLLLVLACALFTIAAKIQLASFVIPVAIAVVWLPHRGSARWWPRRGVVVRAVTRRAPALLVSLALAGSTGYYLLQQPKRQTEVAIYDVVFGSILHDNPSAVADLRDLGLPPHLAKAADTNIISANSIARTPDYPHFHKVVTPATIAYFYLAHPAHALRVFGWGLEGIAEMETHYLGSYPPDSGQPPGAREQRVRVYGFLWGVFRFAPGLLVVLWVLLFCLGLLVVRRRTLTMAESAIGRLAVITPIMIITQMGVVLLGEGRIEATRHQTYVTFLTALAIPLAALCVRYLVIRMRPVSRQERAPGFDRHPTLTSR